MSIEVQCTDEKTIKVPFGDTESVAALELFFEQAANDGYTLKSAQIIQRGNQRDPIAVGLRVTVSR